MRRFKMKPYGIPRLPGNGIGDCGDIVDIQTFARKSSVGKTTGPDPRGKEYKSYIRNSKTRKAIRRTWKKKARQNNKPTLNEEN
jgi:hypothetical protein